MSGYIGTQPVPQATQTRDSFTATANQTSFATSGYTPEFLDVFLNGVKLAASDYTATNGSDVVLASGAAASDILEVVAYSTFEVLNPTFDGNVTFTGNASFGDNDKAIFGDGSDLQIYHDGFNSFISDQGTGHIKILANDFRVVNASNTEQMITANQDGAVTLYNDSVAKLATTSTGIDVTGTLTVDKSQNSETNIELTNTNTGSSAQVRTKYTTDGGLFTVGKTSNAHSFGGDAYIYNVDNTNIRFATSDIERMRIDASGNVLFGGITDKNVFNDTSGTGASINNNAGEMQIKNASDTCLYLNRTGSDGTIISHRKNGTHVGSIGTTGGDLYIATGDTGIRFDDSADQIRASTSAGSNRDGAIDIGFTDSRFKDAYLSGGIYLGGVGSANKLEDYEEGTWTPTVTPSSGSINAFGGLYGTYTKIGREVSLHFQFAVTDIGTGSGNLIVSSLPFAKETSALTYYLGIFRSRSSTSSISELTSAGNLQLYGVTPINSTYLGSITYTTA